jgi:hypothetical protein
MFVASHILPEEGSLRAIHIQILHQEFSLISLRTVAAIHLSKRLIITTHGNNAGQRRLDQDPYRDAAGPAVAVYVMRLYLPVASSATSGRAPRCRITGRLTYPTQSSQSCMLDVPVQATPPVGIFPFLPVIALQDPSNER